MFGTLEEKLEFLFPGGLMEFRSRFTFNMDYEKSIPKILKKEIKDINSAEDLFNLINDIIEHFNKGTFFKNEDLDRTICAILSNVDRKIINNFTEENIKTLFEIGIKQELSDLIHLSTVALVIKKKNPKSVLDFNEVFPKVLKEQKEIDDRDNLDQEQREKHIAKVNFNFKNDYHVYNFINEEGEHIYSLMIEDQAKYDETGDFPKYKVKLNLETYEVLSIEKIEHKSINEIINGIDKVPVVEENN